MVTNFLRELRFLYNEMVRKAADNGNKQLISTVATLNFAVQEVWLNYSGNALYCDSIARVLERH